jgi:hypothetical protein
MINKKQTAVDFLIEQILLTSPKVYKLMIESNSFEHAKEMEKQQIINACNQTEFEEEDNFGIADNLTKGEQYYNEIWQIKDI